MGRNGLTLSLPNPPLRPTREGGGRTVTWWSAEGPQGCAQHTESRVGWNWYRIRSRTRGPKSQGPVGWRVATPRERLAVLTAPTVVSRFVLSVWIAHAVALGGSASSQCWEWKYAVSPGGLGICSVLTDQRSRRSWCKSALGAPSGRVTMRTHSLVCRGHAEPWRVPHNLCVCLLPRPSVFGALGCGKAAPVLPAQQGR